MSFGIVQSMIISLRNNSRKKELIHFDRRTMPLKVQKVELDELLKKKATPQQLEQIRNKIKQERRTELIKNSIILLIVALILITGLKFLIF